MSKMTELRRSLALLAVSLGLAVPMTAAGQETDAALAHRPLAERQELEALEARLSRGKASRQNADVLTAVRRRLKDGDFRSGDEVLIEVQGESTLTDTFTVATDHSLHLPSPVVGTLPLKGVLNAELEPTVQQFLAKFLQHPVVRAWPLLRVSIQGEVARAGFYRIPMDAPIGDALMAAGGATQTADLHKMKIERSGETVLEGSSLQKVLAQGLSFDEADIRDGDRIVVGRRGGDIGNSLRFMYVVVSLAAGIYGLSRAIP